MKRERIKILMLIFVITILITGCSAENSGEDKASIKDAETGTDITNILETVEVEEAPANISAEDVDVDLTALSSTMVYAEVFAMVNEPETYLGKTIRIEGQYFPSYYDETENFYHYVLITDAAACCQSGLEFIWIGNENGYPEDYPIDGTEVELTGVYSSYEELGQIYYYIATDEIGIKLD